MARTIKNITLPASGLPAMLASPASPTADAPVLLFLHGKGEAGSTPGELQKVLIHETPLFQAQTGRLPGAFVFAPQAPPEPSLDKWNWRDHMSIADDLAALFSERRLVACGFSRGGLGVLQLIAQHPERFAAWAAIDPAPPRDDDERAAIFQAPALGRGWLRYGTFRDDKPLWRQFSSALEGQVPERNRDVSGLQHVELAIQAFRGDRLSATSKPNMYESLGLQF